MFNQKLRSELAARTAEVESYKGLIAALDRSMAVVEFSLDGKVIRANENFLKAMGYRADQLPGKSHRDFCEPDLVRSREYSEFWNQLRTGNFVSGTFKRLNAQGQAIWLEASYNPVMDEQGQVSRIVKYALREAETSSKLTALDRAMAVIEFDLNGNILWANDNFLSTMGYAKADLKGKQHRMFCEPSLVNSSEYSDFWRRLNAGEFFSGQFKRIGKNGRTVWLEATYNPVFDAAGKLSQTERVAEQGEQVIQQTAKEMRLIADNIGNSSRLVGQLGGRSEEISAIVNTIRGIAEQTNLLAPFDHRDCRGDRQDPRGNPRRGGQHACHPGRRATRRHPGGSGRIGHSADPQRHQRCGGGGEHVRVQDGGVRHHSENGSGLGRVGSDSPAPAALIRRCIHLPHGALIVVGSCGCRMPRHIRAVGR